MKHGYLVCSLMTVLILVTALAGCTQKDQDLSPSASTIEAILTKAETIDSMYYEVDGSLNASSIATQLVSMKVWDKDPYLKQNITITTLGIPFTISIIKCPEGTYIYNIFTKRYEQNASIPPFVTSLDYIDPDRIRDLLKNNSLTDSKHDIIDGKQATKLNYTVPLQNGHSAMVTVWIWNDMGVPLKAIIELETEITLSLDIVFKNYSFAGIPDDIFDIR